MAVIAIIGGGALSTYAMERLAALAWHSKLRPETLEVIVFEKSGNFGDGDVYNETQPATSLLNTAAGELALGADRSVEAANQLFYPDWDPSFFNWCRRVYSETGDAAYNVDFCQATPRAMYGKALKYSMQQHISLLTELGTKVSLIKSEVTSIRNFGVQSFQVSIDRDYDNSFIADEILLVTGHFHRGEPENSINHSNYTPNPYPLSRSASLETAPPGTKIAIRGMGLSALDVILSLTEGRGGKFIRDEKALRSTALKYIPSSNEPIKIFVFSKSGTFLRARSWLDSGKTRLRTSGWFFNEKAIESLRSNSKSMKIDFETGLFPLIIIEMGALFHAVNHGNVHKCPYGESHQIYDEYKNIVSGDKTSSLDKLLEIINSIAVDKKLFHCNSFFDPLSNVYQQRHEQIISFVDCDNNQARLGAFKSPYKAATEGVWRDLRRVFSCAVDRGRLTPDSHRRFVEKGYRFHNQLANGASLFVMEKILALLRAGLVDASVSNNPSVEFDKQSSSWIISNNIHKIFVSHLIEASIPTLANENVCSRLHENLLANGLLKQYVNSLGTTSYKPGGLDVDERFHPNGAVQPWKDRITILGAQLDGVIFFQASTGKMNSNDGNLNKIAHWANDLALRMGPKES